MQEYITELSKYAITAVMGFYTVCCFAGVSVKNERVHTLYGVQNALLFLLQLLFFVDLTIVSGDIQYVFFYVFVQIFLLAALVMVPMIYEDVNRPLLNIMCMLLGTGLCVISRISFNKAVRQYIIVLVSLIISLFIPYLFSRIRFFKKLTWVYGITGITLLGVVLIMGEVTHGSKITFSIQGITFQPSEFVKILLIFFLAAALWEKTSLSRVALTALIAGGEVLILVLSKDLGSALIFFAAYVFVVFIATGNYLYLLAGAVGGSAAAYAAYLLFDHVQTRVLAWRDPWAYIDNKGWAVTQSLFAIGSGSWFGMGLLQGNPGSIPYVEQDFVFSAVCEELGVLFGVCLLLVIICCFLIMMKIAVQIHDRFYQMIIYGIGIVYIFQIFLTVGGGTNLIPLTGVTLPFISYGGSSCMTTMIMFFIVQAIYIRLQQGGGRRVERKKTGTEGRAAQ
jgi:cell division protein FtsW (lipid II flippase)